MSKYQILADAAVEIFDEKFLKLRADADKIHKKIKSLEAMRVINIREAVEEGGNLRQILNDNAQLVQEIIIYQEQHNVICESFYKIQRRFLAFCDDHGYYADDLRVMGLHQFGF